MIVLQLTSQIWHLSYYLHMDKIKFFNANEKVNVNLISVFPVQTGLDYLPVKVGNCLEALDPLEPPNPHAHVNCFCCKGTLMVFLVKGHDDILL